jgi:mono/diheme cytochrome c family protein
MVRMGAIIAVLLIAGPALAEGDVEKGRAVAIKHCARCHVIGSYNPYGGIDSTPSFQGLAKRADMAERMSSFFERRPHPAFVRVPDVQKWSKALPYATPFTVTPEQIEHLVAFTATLKGWKRPPRRRRQ